MQRILSSISKRKTIKKKVNKISCQHEILIISVIRLFPLLTLIICLSFEYHKTVKGKEYVGVEPGKSNMHKKEIHQASQYVRGLELFTTKGIFKSSS